MQPVKVQLDLSRVALKRRRTKIVATVGPAATAPGVLDQLVVAGVDVFRLNFSHGTHEAHAAAYAAIRAACQKANRHVGVLADLCGPKIRVGKFEGGAIELQNGTDVVVTTKPGVLGSGTTIPSEYEPLARDLKKGHRILLDDGKLELVVNSVEGPEIHARVVHGGKLKDRKGMNLPGAKLSAEAITDKDRSDAIFAAKLGVDFLALSFVRAAADVTELKALLSSHGFNTPVIAKIEMPEALEAIGEIIEVSDGMMVARGDLGVELPPEEVPLIQQELIRVAIEQNKPVIVATQMLESMIESPRPTRAEVSDVAWAAISRADAVMLSAETASGKFPVRAVEAMDRVLRLVEGYQWKHGQFAPVTENPRDYREKVGHAVSHAASLLSRELSVRAVVVPTRSGRTVQITSGERPGAPIIALTHDERLAQRLALLWGVTPVLSDPRALEHPAQVAVEEARRLGLAEPGQSVLLIWDSAASELPTPTVTVLTLPGASKAS